MFKTCTTCDTQWPTLEDFLSDKEVVMAGYQVAHEDLKGGLFFFTHQKEGCFTTLAIPVTDFLPLNERPLLTQRDDQVCIGSEFCQHQGDLIPKPQKCECIWVRDILETIKTWPKKSV